VLVRILAKHVKGNRDQRLCATTNRANSIYVNAIYQKGRCIFPTTARSIASPADGAYCSGRQTESSLSTEMHEPAGARPVTIDLEGARSVSGLLERPSKAHALLVLAHGAGAGMRHPFMAAAARELATLGIATLRYQFPYMERRSKRPDSPTICHATVRAAVASARQLEPNLPLIAGGKSFGGRMTSQAQAISPLVEVRGLVFLGFPLHPPHEPAAARAEHLSRVHIPMLFLQGTRDEFAASSLLLPLIERLGECARLTLLEGADHSFHIPARSGRTDSEVRTEWTQALAAWVESISR